MGVKLSSRRWRILGLVIAGMVIAVVGGKILLDRMLTVPWEAMERARDSAPVPPGFSISDRTRIGDDDCAINPGCESPRVFLTMTSDDGTASTCADAKWIADHWSGFTADKPEKGVTVVDPPGHCAIDGKIGGRFAGIDFFAGNPIQVTVGTKSS